MLCLFVFHAQYRHHTQLLDSAHYVLVTKPSIGNKVGCPYSATNGATNHAGGHLDLGLTNRLVVTLRPGTASILKILGKPRAMTLLIANCEFSGRNT